MDISNHKFVDDLIWYDRPLLQLYTDGTRFFHYHWADFIDELIDITLIYEVSSIKKCNEEYTSSELREMILSATEVAICTSTTGEYIINRVIKPHEVPEKWLPIP